MTRENDNQVFDVIRGAALRPSDLPRLENQMRSISSFMEGRDWMTVSEIARWFPQYPETSISASVRNIRKTGQEVMGRYREGTKIYEYKIVGKGQLQLL